METQIEKKAKNDDSTIFSVGRRKEAIARVNLTSGNGQIIINGKPIIEYFSGAVAQKIYSRPFEVTKSLGKYNIIVKVEGGGTMAQLGAIVHGFTKAIIKKDPNLKSILKKEGLTTRDARVKERRKYGHAHKARAMKQSPKR